MSFDTTGKKLWAGVAAIVLLIGGFYTVSAMVDSSRSRLASDDSGEVLDALTEMDQKELSGDGNEDVRRKALSTLKNASLEEVFERMRSDDLTDEQRERLRENMGRLMRESVSQNADEYFAANTDDERNEILDRHIAEWEQFREKMRAYREKHKEDFERDGQKERREGREGRGWAPSKERRKDRMENTSPDDRARMFQYFMKMRARAQETGKDMGGPFGGRRGEKRGR